MKPPPRVRKSVLRSSCPTSQDRDARRSCTWPRKEQKMLLDALNSQSSRRDGSSSPVADLDYHLLQKAVPSRSVSEIQSVVECLRQKVVSGALSQMRQSASAEKKAVAPIDGWRRLAEAVSGNHKSPLSNAFSQMWVIASTEPVAVRDGQHPGPESSGGTPEPVTPSTSAANEGPTSSGAAPGRMSAPMAATSCRSQDLEVNFERIYKYLGAVHNLENKCELTAMESAVVLELVMSLPEELELLQFQSLRRHLIQTQQNLSKAEDSDQAREAMTQLKKLRRDVPAPPPAGAEGQTTASVEPTWTGLCPPLNPFMIPLELLKRS
ncbi:snRNA-activating protein complex subunit 2 [Stigmatopora nigra]